jgi:Domain of unknown function (DUF4386)
MNTYKKAAISAGVLFIIATVANILSLPFLAPMKATNYLVSVSANGNQVATGALLLFIAAAAAVGIAISLYPVLRKYNEGLALGAAGFRLIEGVFYIVAVMGLLLLITLSQQFVKAGAPDSSYFQTLGVLVVAGYRWVGNVGSLLAFSIGALLYYYIFYQTRLVPRWLSGWGLVAIILTMVSGLLVMFGLIGPMSTGQVVLNLPIGVQEMVLAVWLIVKGFNSSAIASLSAKTATN